MLQFIAPRSDRPWKNGTQRIVSVFMACLLCSTAHAGAVNLTVDKNAPWVESAICSVAIKSELDANKPIQLTSPIDNLVSVPANCTGNVMLRAEVMGGVRSLLVNGWRIANTSHQVTSLRTLPSGQVDLLISGIFVLERPQIINAISR